MPCLCFISKNLLMSNGISVGHVIFYLRPSFFWRHLNLATLVNFWKSLNLSGAKIKISLFFSFFDQTGEWQKKSSISRQNTDQYCVSTLLLFIIIQCTKYSVLLFITFMFYVFIIVVLSRPNKF